MVGFGDLGDLIWGLGGFDFGIGLVGFGDWI